MIVAGSFIMGFAIKNMYDPMNLVTGGVSGAAIIVKSLTGIPLWATNTVLNIPLFLAAWRLKGWNFIRRTLVATMSLSVSLYVIPEMPLVEGDSEIVLTSPLESRGYVDMTLDVLERFGVTAREVEDGFAIPGGQRYKPCAVTVEADWSQGAFWIAAKRLGHPVETLGLDEHSTQGDRVIREFSAAMDRPGELELDVSGCPDLAPPLAAMAALRAGQVTRLVKAARLRLKESDRLTTVAQMLKALGGAVSEEEDGLTVYGVSTLHGGTVDGANDHRIVMAAAIAASRCQSAVVIRGAEAVKKSYPTFWRDYEALGGAVHVL